MTALIHPTAVINKNAQIHPTAEIKPYAVIGSQVKIGANTVVGSHAIIDGLTTIGRDNQIFPGAAIGLEPQDLKYKGANSEVIIGDRNRIREYVTINRATEEGEATVIGNDNLLMAYSHVGHNCTLKNEIVIANSVRSRVMFKLSRWRLLVVFWVFISLSISAVCRWLGE